MLIDHIAWAFVPTASLLGQVMQISGRLTGPTMAYMLAEGYRYTRSVKKYAMRLGIFAVISWLPFSYFESGGIRPAFGVIYTLFLSLLAIWFWDKAKCSVSVKWLAVLVLCILSVFGDWAMFDVLYALTFVRSRTNVPKESSRRTYVRRVRRRTVVSSSSYDDVRTVRYGNVTRNRNG